MRDMIAETMEKVNQELFESGEIKMTTEVGGAKEVAAATLDQSIFQAVINQASMASGIPQSTLEKLPWNSIQGQYELFKELYEEVNG